LVSPGATVSLPIKKMAPRSETAAQNLPEWNIYGPETPGLSEACFFFETLGGVDGWSRAVLQSAAGDRGASVKFNTRLLPLFTLWKSRLAAADGYVTGLEPSINFPNCRSFEKQHGRVAVLAPGEIRRFEVAIEAHHDAASLRAAKAAVAAIQGAIKPEILTQPNPDWSPV
jgi:hypothetical protein